MVSAVGLWRPLPSRAGITVLCEPVDCEEDIDCGLNGECDEGDCACASDVNCPPGSQCIPAVGICVVCPPTRTPTTTPTATQTFTPSATPTPTSSATPTPSVTPTSTGMPGTACTAPGECATGFCEDGVCCDRECDGPAEQCNVTGDGTCTSISATAPLMSARASFFVVLLLASIGIVALARQRRGTRG